MTLWLRFIPTGSFNLPLRINVSLNPAPAVMAGGMNTLTPQQHFLEDDGMDAVTPKADKPPYAVPTMAQVARIRWNGLTVVSTFAGCGGSSLGYRMAGYRVLWANEFVPAAQDSYRANMRAGTVLDPRDIKEVQPEEVLKACGLKAGELDVFDGSPPCQAFSTAGKRHRGWGQERGYEGGGKQRNEDLFFEYVRLLRGLKPRAFVAENVSGLVKGVAKGYFLEVLAELKASGYAVEARVLDAQWLGVPQTRSRVIFAGTRTDLGLAPAFPKPLLYRYSVRDACPWIGGAVEDPHGQPSYKSKRRSDEPVHCVRAGNSSHLKAMVESDGDISRYAIGAEARKLSPGQTSKKYFQLQRAHPDKPSPAILANSGNNNNASVIHPTEQRKFTIAELKRICSFPDDFALTGSYGQQWERLGNSVPPVMMRAIAEALKPVLLGR